MEGPNSGRKIQRTGYQRENAECICLQRSKQAVAGQRAADRGKRQTLIARLAERELLFGPAIRFARQMGYRVHYPHLLRQQQQKREQSDMDSAMDFHGSRIVDAFYKKLAEAGCRRP
jgi:hypothetical protein